MGAYLVWSSYSVLRQESRTGQLALARSLASNVQQTLVQAQNTIELLLSRPELRNFDKKALKKELPEITNATELFDSMLVLGPDAQVRAVSWPETPQVPIPPRDLFLRGMKARAGAGTHYDVYWTRDGKAAVCVWAPILRGGASAGFLAGLSLLPNHAIGRLNERHLGSNGDAFIADRDGVVLEHRGSAMTPPLVQRQGVRPAIDAAALEQDGIVQYTSLNDRDMLAAFARVPISSWKVIVERPAADSFRPAADMLRFMIAFLAGTLVLAAVIAGFTARMAAKPIDLLIRQVRSIEDGSRAVPSAGAEDMPMEFSVLSKALTTMLRRLRAEERQRERAHQRAVVAERHLSESERLASVGQLAAGLAHELNNPLTVIKGAAQMIPQVAPSRVGTWTAEIVRETDRCHRLVKDLLDFAKPVVLDQKPFKLKALCLDAWQHVVKGRATKVRLVLPDGDAGAVGDDQRLMQVLINLFNNALDASPDRGVIRVTWSKTASRVSVAVRDSGHGLDGESEALFRPFFTTKTKGNGLGLPLARSIVQAHGGTLTAAQGKQGGAVFTMEWPQKRIKRRGA
jgi:signal transduction histidine kinase